MLTIIHNNITFKKKHLLSYRYIHLVILCMLNEAIIVAPIFSGVVDMDPPLSPGGRRTYDLCGTCKRTMDNEVPLIKY